MKKGFCLLFILLISKFDIYAQCKDTIGLNQSEINLYCSIFFENGKETNGLYSPVCGCDGITYPSFYCAQVSGVKQWTEGACDCIEKKNYNDTYLNWGFKQIPIPRNPVCGCDDKTYMDENHAYYSGIMSWSKGSCRPCIDSAVIDLNIDITACSNDQFNNLCRNTFLWGVNVPSLRGCDGKFYTSVCEAYYRNGVTRFSDEQCCLVLPENERDTLFDCLNNYEPVCGCDQKTYQNACIATKHFGVVDFYDGECICDIPDLVGQFSGCKSSFNKIFYDPVCACDGRTYYNECIALDNHGVVSFTRGAPCKCIDSTFIADDANCYQNFDPICGCDGHGYLNICQAIYQNGVMGHIHCRCIEPDLIDLSKKCNEILDYEPVCGCDGRTYPNLCYANYKAGIVKIELLKGPCPNTCQDSIFVVKDFPCSQDYEPVCGCNNVTYINECDARYNHGVIKWRQGECTVSTGDGLTLPNNISFFPNPTYDGVHINCHQNSKFNQYSIYDINMKLISSQAIEIKNGSYLDLSNIFLTGIYFLKLQNSENNILTKLVVIR